MKWFKQKKIVVPYDFSDESKSAIEVALELAEKQSDIHIIHVMHELSATDPAVIWHSIDDEKRRRRVTESFAEKTADLNINDVHFEVGIGNPGAVIADMAEEVGAGMIVIPSHGRTGFTRLMLGSVAERVVRLAKCPVLVLKKQRES
jgi:nucleotide-binding universal stress UspA family protein